MFTLQVLLVLVIIYFGIKYGGVALGLLGGLGVSILAFAFGIVPSKPPIDVMLIIIAVVTTSATLEATGALNLIVNLAESVLRKNPKYVTILAPVTTFSLTMLVGTGHAVYPLIPVIYDVAYRQGIRPERPMAVASIASQMGITASPIAAASAAVIGAGAVAGVNISIIDILSITIPCGLIGMLTAAFWSLNRGLDLDKDPSFIEKMKDPSLKEYIEGGSTTTLNNTVSKQAKISLYVFLFAIVSIVCLAMMPQLLPMAGKKPLSMTIVIQMVMLAAGAIILFLTNIKPKAISDSKVFNAGMVAVIMIFGIAWMSETVIEHNKSTIIEAIKSVVNDHPWTFALAMFTFSAFLKSQAATLTIMMPLGFALDVPVPIMLASIPASYAYFFFCFYPSDLATINFDRTGSTYIGKYILNHSFMIPGLIGVGTASTLAYILSVFILN